MKYLTFSEHESRLCSRRASGLQNFDNKEETIKEDGYEEDEVNAEVEVTHIFHKSKFLEWILLSFTSAFKKTFWHSGSIQTSLRIGSRAPQC